MNMLTNNPHYLRDKMLEIVVRQLAADQFSEAFGTNFQYLEIEELQGTLEKDPVMLAELVKQVRIHIESEVNILIEKRLS